MSALHSAITGLTIVLIVAVIVFGVSQCSERSNELRIACVNKGGSVIPVPGQDFACLVNQQMVKP